MWEGWGAGPNWLGFQIGRYGDTGWQDDDRILAFHWPSMDAPAGSCLVVACCVGVAVRRAVVHRCCPLLLLAAGGGTTSW